MGYFSNGSEGADYQERYCNHCVHDVNLDCPIWMLHLLWNSEAAGDEDKAYVLNRFIPIDGITNGECTMFIDTNGAQELPF